MTVVWAFVGLGVLLTLAGWAGRRNAYGLGAVPGMPAEHEAHRIRVIRRGASVCVVVGVAFVVVGAMAPWL